MKQQKQKHRWGIATYEIWEEIDWTKPFDNKEMIIG
jgi:hypothetical protein